jgi:hypothetical protein
MDTKSMKENELTQSSESTAVNTAKMQNDIEKLKKKVERLEIENKKLWDAICKLNIDIPRTETNQEKEQRLSKEKEFMKKSMEKDINDGLRKYGQ